ncbi:MAG: SH3 domain-containing protein [Kiritimatiellaeota bacterium]|nr:SH3 domain-containing protein [Kiritimatiellota bacterium]
MRKDFHAVRNLAAFCFILLAASARAGVMGAWVEVSNARPYVGEAFVFTLRATVTPSTELERENILGLERYPLALGTLRRAGRARAADGNEVISYTGVFRPTAAFASRLELTLTGTGMEQRRNGFFTQWVGSPFRVQAAPREFTALALPTTGRPENFSGAVGTFTLDVQYSRNEVRARDVVTREIRLRGALDNWAGTLMPDIPGLGADFTVYEPVEVSRADNPPELVLRQQFFPLNTNTTEAASPSFSFFDPKAGAYRTLQPPPEKFVFIADDAPITVEHKILGFEKPARNDAKNALPTELALPRLRGAEERVEITRPTQARLAPSGKAVVLFELEPGASVTVAERADGWARVVSRGRAGWIHGFNSDFTPP